MVDGERYDRSAQGSLAQVDQWAWEVSSDAGSMPSAWSRPSTVQSSASRSSLRSRISANDGDSVIPGLIEGQRLSYVKPLVVSCDSGGKVVVGMKKQVPQGFWDYIEVALVNGPDQVKLKPTGIKKGKKLCVEVPSGLAPGDYDVRLVFAQKILHGAITLTLRRGGAEVDDEFDDEDS
jgi:hypothetical protein